MKKSIILLILFISAISLTAKEYIVKSPNGKLKVTVTDGEILQWSIQSGDDILLLPSKLSLEVKNQKIQFGVKPSVQKVLRKSVDEVVEAIVPTKQRNVREHYNELTLKCKGNYSVTFRVYDNGAAYRFETNLKEEEIFVANESVEFNLAGDYTTYWPKDNNPEMITHNEAHFDYLNVSDIPNTRNGYLPIYMSSEKGKKMVIMEADLFDYPNMFLYGTSGNTLIGKFPPVILEKEPKNGSDRDEKIIRNSDYLAKTDGKRNFPWRLIMITEDDKSLLENNLVYQLSRPEVEGDLSWIKPGKISWEWWSGIDVYDVDFVSGVNTATYKYFIDFAAKYGLEYILLDEGWSVSTTNISEPRAEIDMAELVRYGESKGVGIVLWALWKPLEQNIEGILDIYQKWGIKGIKVDFMQRSDQDMVNYYEAVAKAAFDRKILVDFHGSFKPSGLHRKYPNVMTYEGVYGAEHHKCSFDITPKHNLLLPFTRMTAGPMDYTPGATMNAEEGAFSERWTHPMSQGTRAHQVALFIVYESPLQMIADSPTNYYKTPEFIEFISKIPTVWDETKALSGTIGEELSIARRNGNNWYIAAMTNWDERKKTIELDFIDDQEYDILIFQDGVNANRNGADFKVEKRIVSKGDTLNIHMYKGGGWAAILSPKK